MHTYESGLQVAVVENGVVHLRKSAVVRDLGRKVEINGGVRRDDRRLLPRRSIPAGPRHDPGAGCRNGDLGRHANSKSQFIKRYLMVRPIAGAYVFPERPTALAPGGGVS
jgi:hypothetical protein